MGWEIDWVSAETDFHRDLGFFYTEEELKPFLESGQIPLTVTQNAEMCGTDAAGYVAEGPGLSVYTLSDGTVYGTYVSTARGLEYPMAYYGLLDRTPAGETSRPTSRSGSGATTSTRPGPRESPRYRERGDQQGGQDGNSQRQRAVERQPEGRLRHGDCR